MFPGQDRNLYFGYTLVLQDLFSSGAIKSATDFQVYKEVAGLSGLDFAYADNTAVYHTKVSGKSHRHFILMLYRCMLRFIQRFGQNSNPSLVS